MDIAKLGLEIRSDGVVVATDRLRKFDQAARRSETSAGALTRGFGLLRGALAGLAAAFSIRALVQFTSAWTDLNSRVINATGSIEKGAAVMARLTDMSRRTYSSLTQTAESWLANASSLKAMGYSTEQQLDLTESLNDALVISATRGDRARSVMDAWSKAMALGKLSGDNLNTIIQSGDRLSKALADSMGVSVLQLRSLGAAGKITAKDMFGVTTQLEQLRKEADAMPATIQDAFVLMGNAVLEFVGKLDQASGTSSAVAGFLIDMADGLRNSIPFFIQLGTVIATVVGPAFDLLASNMDTIVPLAEIAGAALLGIVGPAIIGGVLGLAAAIAGPVVGAFVALDAVLMANPLLGWIGVISAVVAALFIFRDEIKQTIGVDVIEVIKNTGNRIIGVFVGAYEATKDAWKNLPTFFSAIGKQAWNSFVSSFEGPAITIKTPWGDWQSGGLDLSGAKAQLTDAEKASFGAAKVTMGDAMSRDYFGDMADGLSKVWRNAEGAQAALADLSGDGGGSSAPAAVDKAAQKAAKAYAKLIQSGHQFIDEQNLEARTLGMTEEAASGLRHTQELLNKAANDNIALTPQQTAELTALGSAMAAAEAATKRAKDAFDFAKDATKGFLSDLRQGLMEGKSFWDAFGNAALNVLDKIINKVEDQLVDALFSLGSGGGGSGGGLFGWLGSLLFNAKGNVFDRAGQVHAFARGGIVSQPTVFPFARGIGLMGEAGPEAIMPLRRGPDGRLGVAAHNQNSVSRVHVTIGVDVDDSGNILPFVKSVSQQTVTQAAPAMITTSVTQASKAAPGAMAKYQRQVQGGDYRTM